MDPHFWEHPELGKERCDSAQLAVAAALGAWISKDLAANEREIGNLIAAARAGEADLLIVGSEVLLRGELSATNLIGYINRVKQAALGIPVGYADIYGELLAHPDIIAASDVVFVNYYPYWEGIRVDVAMAVIHTWHQQMIAAAQGKPVIVSEAGWPSAGDQRRNAVPSLENANFFFRNFVSWARANQVDYFYFEAFDESWKVRDEGTVGAHWGVWDKDGNLKAGMEAVFNGATLPDNWTLLGGPGKLAIEFTYVPPYGSFDNLTGQVWHVKPADYKVAVYIYVPSGGGWWTKPYFNNPLTSIEVDGTWTCDITTGGRDETATRIAAFLVPNGFDPPLVGASATLPAILEEKAVAKIEITREAR